MDAHRNSPRSIGLHWLMVPHMIPAVLLGWLRRFPA